MQIAIISGEASGDRVGGQLATEIRRLRPDVEIWGTGGRFLREAGAEVVVDSSRWGVVGIVAGLTVVPRILRARRFLLAELLRRKPDVVVPIDAGAFHLGFAGIEGMCAFVRRCLSQTKILYYFPPSSWRRTLRGSPLGPLTDKVATPFPWSETELRRLGVDATFVGHPLLDLVHPSEAPTVFAERYGIDAERPVVGLLPGSRRQEIAHILPVQLEAAAIVHQRVPGVQFLLALAPTVDREQVVHALEALRHKNAHLHDAIRRAQDRLREGASKGLGAVPQVVTTGGAMPPPRDRTDWHNDWAEKTRQQLAQSNAQRSRDFALTIVENATYDVMAASDVLMAASGTVTLEAAILGRPMVILYRMSKANKLEYQFVKKSLPQWIGMPNLLAQRRICPEFIQDAATPDAVSGEIIGMLLEPDRMLRMREDLRQAVSLLGEPGGAARAAAMVVELGESDGGNLAARETVKSS